MTIAGAPETEMPGDADRLALCLDKALSLGMSNPRESARLLLELRELAAVGPHAALPLVRAKISLIEAWTLQSGDLPNALARAEEARDAFAALDAPELLLKARFTIGFVLEKLGRAEEALSDLRALERDAAEIGDRELEARARNVMGIALIRLGRPGEAAALLREVVDAAGTIGDPALIFSALGNLGVCHNEAGNHADALACFTRCQDIARTTGDRRGLAGTLLTVQRTWSVLGDHARTLECLSEALAIGQEIGSRELMAMALNNMGQVHMERGDPAEAAALTERSLALKIEMGNRPSELVSRINLAEAWAAQGRHDAALDEFDRVLVIAEEIGAVHARMQAFPTMGRTLAMAGRHAEAVAVLTEALAWNEGNGRRPAVAEILLELGRIGPATGLMEPLPGHDAGSRLSAAFEAAEALGASKLMVEAAHALAEHSAATGDAVAAVAWFRRHAALRAALFTEESDRRFRMLQAVHQVEHARQEAEIQRLRTVELAESLEAARRARAEAELAHQRLRSAIDTAPDGIAAFDAVGRLVAANHRMGALLRGLEDGLAEGADRALETIRSTALETEGDRETGLDLRLPDGRWLNLRSCPVPGGGLVLRLADVTAYRVANERLGRALATEQALNQTYRSFVAMVSHQFRSPLAIIDSSAQRLLRRGTALDGEELADRVGRIRAATGRLVQLMEGTLNAARFDAGELEIKPRPCDLGPLVQATVASLCDAFEGAEVRCVVESQPDATMLDPALIEHVLGNLLSNAVKYSPPGAPVEVRVRSRGAGAVVEVTDQGVGIPADDIPRIFDRFFRARTASDRPGTGIGLSIAREIARLHGGDIHVLSKEGVGSTFTLILPAGDRDLSNTADAVRAPVPG